MVKKAKKLKLPAGVLKKSQPGRSSVPSWQNLLQKASALQKAGRLTEAEALCRQILSSDPTHPEALHFLGMLAHQVGKDDLAIAMIRKALNRKPDDVEACYNLGFLLLTTGRADEAVIVYKRLLDLKPGYVEAHNNLGNAYLELGELEEAATCFRKAIALKPGYVEAHNNLGITLKTQEKLNEAAVSFRQTLALKPDFAEAHTNLGNTYLDLGQLDEAVTCLRQALTFKPDLAEAHYILGETLKKQGKMDKAMASFLQSLSLEPNHYGALMHLGIMLQERRELDKAISLFRQALTVKPNSAETLYNLGLSLYEQGKLDEAVASYRQAISLKPDYAKAYNNLGFTLQSQIKLDEAVACYRNAIALEPGFVRAHQNLLFCLNYLPKVTQQEIYEQSLQWEELVAGKLKIHEVAFTNIKDPRRRLKIGYVSADFNKHSVAYFFEPLLKAHDRENIEVFCYSNVKKPDERTSQFETEADHWISILDKDDPEVAAQIRKDRIDILVDLGGHTRDNRLLVFAWKPAPIQVTWLGYPNTTGMSAIDYRFTDMIADPPVEADRYHSEKLIRLEHGFLCYQPDDFAPEVGPPPCLKLDYLTFGSFNNLPKVTTEVVRVWAEILRQHPGSRLRLKSRYLSDHDTREKYLRLFGEQGIPADRLEMLGWQPDIKNHLELYHSIDIALDTFPYNGTTTTCEALWMGVPVITLRGERHAARVGSSIMHQVGLEELVAHAEEEYITMAASLAGDRKRLSALRSRQRRLMQESQLMDGKLFTTSVEKTYRKLWEEWCIKGD